MADILPGIGMNESTIDEIKAKIDLVADSVSWVQIDFSDGSLVEKLTVMDMSQYKTLVESYPKLSFEAHLMVSNPIKYLRSLSEAGFKRIVIHVESDDPRAFLNEASYESVEVGLAIDGPTEFEQIEPFLGEIDFVLVMTIEMGASGKAFMPETIEKIKIIRENLPDLPIEVDGGMNESTSKVAREVGATRIVSTSFLFTNHAKSISQGVKLLGGS